MSKNADEKSKAQNDAAQAENTADDFEEKLKKAGEEIFDSAKDAKKGRTAAAKELETLKAELAESKDRTLRAMAELENFRLRKNKELADEQKYAPMKLARDILPVWDNLGRALEAAPADESVQSFVDGVRMVHQQFLDVLAKNGVVRIPAEGEKFDPNIHESIAMLPSDKPAGIILHDTRPGFALYDRVVRPAQVVVAAPQPNAPKPEQPKAENTEETPAE